MLFFTADPENITIKLTDCAFSKYLDVCNLGASAINLTRSFQPPEKIIDGDFDESGDVW